MILDGLTSRCEARAAGRRPLGRRRRRKEADEGRSRRAVRVRRV